MRRNHHDRCPDKAMVLRDTIALDRDCPRKVAGHSAANLKEGRHSQSQESGGGNRTSG